MAQVITQIEMMRYQGAPLAVFPEGTILTPSAKDWAREQGIEVRIGGSDADTGQEFLDQVVGSVIRQYRSTGKKPCERRSRGGCAAGFEQAGVHR